MKSGRYIRNVRTCLLAGAVLASSLAFPHPVRAELFVYDGEYEWEEEEAPEFYSDSGYDDEAYGQGGYALNPGMETDSIILDGPAVNQVTLQEQYHEDFKVYELSMDDRFFFYASVGNGGITNQPVTLDIPHNITYTMEKDGLPWDYAPGQTISEYGTYVIRLTGVEDTKAALSEQAEYRAVFRFRIQAKPMPDAEEASGGTSASSGGSGWTSFTYDGRPLSEEQESSVLNILPGGAEEREEEGESSQSEEESQEEEAEGTGEENPTEGDPRDESQAENEGEPEGIGEENGEGAEATAGAIAPAENGFWPRTQKYDTGSRQYQVTFTDGSGLGANVPEGYMGSGPVAITVPKAEEERAVLYRDDEPVEYVWGDSLTEPGHYRAELEGGAWSCTIASYVSGTDYYPAPAGMEFVSAFLDGEPMELSSRAWMPMEQDGQYQFTLEGQGGETLEGMLLKDTTPPEIGVTVKGGTAAIQYLSEDIETIRLEKNRELVEGFSGYAIDSPGDYLLTVADYAGNEASSRFTLKYRVNRYGVVAVVLVILLILGGAVFVVHTKKTVKIR